MNVLLLAAGRGTRLMPVTRDTPKCLASINGTPLLLKIWLDKLSQSGLGPIFVNRHYLAPMVREFVQSTIFSTELPYFTNPYS